ncbi:putative oxidoreductase [Morococcus cerebrosus]|uniref:Putative oxidoreductase n=1 Tax=Morococcus cerebrosus TaxID=1056807 RepID=A0A0C1GKY7_9NEIS|nr:putative oxidoreductase [Morococcus cerebrosus]
MLFKVLTLLELMFSDGIGGRLKALASTKLKVKTANRQSTHRVRAYRTHPTRWF